MTTRAVVSMFTTSDIRAAVDMVRAGECGATSAAVWVQMVNDHPLTRADERRLSSYIARAAMSE